MNILNGFLLVGFAAFVMACVCGLMWVAHRIDPWVVRYPRVTITLFLAGLAVVLFLIGAGAIR